MIPLTRKYMTTHLLGLTLLGYHTIDELDIYFSELNVDYQNCLNMICQTTTIVYSYHYCGLFLLLSVKVWMLLEFLLFTFIRSMVIYQN